MLDNIKYLLSLKSVDKDISEKNYDLALEKLNSLIKEEYKPSETFLKRGRLCHKLLMLDDAYSDFTYIITHCVKKEEAYYERVALNYEMSNYYEAIMDANKILGWDEDNFNIKRIKFLSFVFSSQEDIAKGIIYMVLQTIGGAAVLSALNGPIKDFVLIGNLTKFPQCHEVFPNMEKIYGVRFHIPPYAEYRTAIGAALAYLSKH